MQRFSLSRQMHTFILIFLCFLWTSTGYLSWLYRLLDELSGQDVEMASEVAGYSLQALGLLCFALLVRRRPDLAGRRLFAVLTGADLACLALAVLLQGQASILLSGSWMNLFHGVLAGFYLHRLALDVDWNRRGLIFGPGYGAASFTTWLLSLIGQNNYLQSVWILPVCAVLASLSVWIYGLRGDAYPDSPAREHALDGRSREVRSGDPARHTEPEMPARYSEPRNALPEEDNPAAGLIALAAASVVILSMVKGLGFSFPSADLRQGVNLELSRVFYAVGLIAAGIISDRERKYGAVICVASLGIPFLMIAMTDNLSPSIVFWIIGYLLFGFFTVFRVLLFSDLANKGKDFFWISGFGLLFGRIGDALGALGCILLGERPVFLVALAAALFALTIVCFLLLYQRVYLPAPLPARSEQERFIHFAESYDLSGREREVLQLILDGRSTPEIAGTLFIAESTVKFHIHNLLKKTSCPNRTALISQYQKSK